MWQATQLLFAAGFNVQQMLATGVIGGGAALMITPWVQVFKKPQPPAEGQPEPKKLHPAVALALSGVGLVLLILGIVWRVNSRQAQ